MKHNKIAVRPNEIVEARYNLKKKQNDILDVLLTQLKDDGNYSYELNVDDFKNIYKTDTSNIYRDMKKACKLFERAGFYVIETGKDEEIWYHWFSKIHYKNKEGKIVLNIDPDLKRILMESSNNIPYNINYTLNFSSSYTHRVYMFLKKFEDTGWRISTVQYLVEKMECPSSYNNFYNFKKNVLDVAQKELNSTSNSDIGFEYDPIYDGKKVTRVKFTIIKNENKNKIIEISNENVNHKELSVESIKSLLKDRLTKGDCNKIIKLYKGASDEERLNDYEDFKTKITIVDKYIFDNNKHDEPYIALLISAIKNDWGLNKPKKDDNKGNYTGNNSKRVKKKDIDLDRYKDSEEMDFLMFLGEQTDLLDEAAIGIED